LIQDFADPALGTSSSPFSVGFEGWEEGKVYYGSNMETVGVLFEPEDQDPADAIF